MLDTITLTCLLTFISSVVCTNNTFENIPDYDLRLEELVVRHGYPIEVHQIITEDGYILAAYRIQKQQSDNKNKSAILIVHGMGGTPHYFLLLGKKRSSAYYLADRGMDVWLFSSRGGETPFEKKHVKLDWNKDSAYWSHSFHEIGIYDLAATIDYVLNCTRQEKIIVIGHSEGGHTIHALMSEKPEYNRKVKLLISWGTAPILRRMDYPVILLGIQFGGLAKVLIKFLRIFELIPPAFSSLKRHLIELLTKKDPFWCKSIKFSLDIGGGHKSVMHFDEFYPTFVSHLPRLSSKRALHLLDNIHNGTFRKFDYGPKGNLKRYGQTEPPHYNLSAVTAPSAFFSAPLDAEITLEDVYESILNLPNTIYLYRIPFYRFNHVDYIFGHNATELVYEPTYQLIKKIDSGNIPPRVKNNTALKMAKCALVILALNFPIILAGYIIHPEVDLNLEQRIKRHGYPVETYKTFTKDGYILPVYHIPHGLKKPTAEIKNKSAILLVHGMGASPHTYIILGPKFSLPYFFADRGYDVWLFSARGVRSTLERKHKKYDWDKDRKYWMFSLHEISIYDLPSTIDFVLNYTGQEKLSLIGHSAAGNEFFSMFSDRPQYNEKVKIAISWGSSPIVKRTDYPLAMLLSALVPVWKGLNRLLRASEFLPMFKQFWDLVKDVCANPNWTEMCNLCTAMIGSHKSVIQNPKDIQIIASNLPRLSGRQLFHFMDNFNNGTFRKYDYGPKINIHLYGQRSPPHYNLSAATAPTAFFIGSWDSIINIEDIYESVAQIPNTVLIYQIPFDKFTHTDFIFARKAASLVYKPTLKLIKDIDDGLIILAGNSKEEKLKIVSKNKKETAMVVD
ncbi:unnamed protein product [Ceutorhynchus assimilis]|uniref:Partial AB-hydrolase lipase domain-containing protein n=1 Tax=Ceutorhynchus assimilis TaxID=467358 RepID=A0A9N9MP30_9CUCU|nr:unnamed protein product [Ceutorhynchus assimilis]